jgi:hypothetical protein
MRPADPQPRDPAKPPRRPLDRVLNHISAPAATSLAPPATPRLDAFVSAAAAGQLLWARWQDGRLEVCSGATPAHPISAEIGRLFVMALREQFGEAASAIAEREWRLGLQPRRLLPARTVRHAVACADSALSLLMAQSHLMQIEFSAVMLGWRFRRVAEGLGLDPRTLGVERRQALDQMLEADFKAPLPADADAVSLRLRALLTQGTH